MQTFDSYVYLDYAATAPLREDVAQLVIEHMQAGQANLAYAMNTNSLHSPGRKAFELMERYRKELANALGAKRPSEIIFTSGATEADNAALYGLAYAQTERRHYGSKGESKGHIIVSQFEHSAVLKPAQELKRQGYELSFLKPNKAGFIEPETLRNALQENTILVSVMMANSEVGSIQDVKALAQIAHDANALFHTDATQALGKMPIDLAGMGVDAASFSAHKIGSLKGVGALYLKARTPFKPLLIGGGQEEGRRSTTSNICGMAAFACAATAVKTEYEQESARLRELRDYLYANLSEIPKVSATLPVETGSTQYLPNIVHVLVDGFESETLVLRLDSLGFAVSGGSACSSHSLEPSHVLKALDVPVPKAFGALRISMGSLTTKEQLDAFVEALKDVIGAK